MATTPKHIINKMYKMSKLMDQLVSLNTELEEWLESKGAENGFDFTFDYRESQGYEIYDIEGFIDAISEL